MGTASSKLRVVMLVTGIVYSLLGSWAVSQVIINNAAGVRVLGGRVGGAFDLTGGTGSDGFTVRKVSSDLSIVMEDFARFCEKQEWEKAFSSLPELVGPGAGGLVDVGNGLYMPIRVRYRQMLTGLSPAGREAYRVFNDAAARQGLMELTPSADPDGPSVTNERGGLQELFDKYFITAVGDQIGDRLGDAQFEAGDFSAAAQTWDAVIRDFPDSTVSLQRLNIKRAIALAKARRWDDFAAASDYVTDRWADERIRVGGEEVSIKALMLNLAQARPLAGPTTLPAPSADPIRFPSTNEPVWQSVFADDGHLTEVDRLFKSSGMAGYSMNPIMIPPRAVSDGNRIYLNWFGIFIAIDAQTGKLLFRSGTFTGLATVIRQSISMGMDPVSDLSILMIPGRDRVLVVGPQTTSRVTMRLADGSLVQSTPSQLTCYSTLDFTSPWKSSTTGLSTWTLLGRPLLDGEVIYITGRPLVNTGGAGSGTMDMNVLALDALTGRMLWSLPIGTMSDARSPQGRVAIPKPILMKSGDRLFIQTDDKALVTVNLATRTVDWAYTWGRSKPGDQPQAAEAGQLGVPRVYRQLDPLQWPSSIAISEAGLFIKERNSASLYSFDPGRPALNWEQSVELSSSIAAADENSVYLLGRQLDCLDLRTRQIRWTARLPGINGAVDPVRIGSRLFIFSARGLYDVDLTNGEAKLFQGHEQDGYGGLLLRAGNRLISVSNRAVTAYPVAVE